MTGVLHVITGLATGGAETMLAQLVGALQLRGLPQHVVSLKGWGLLADRLETAGVPVTTLRISCVLSAPRVAIQLALLTRRPRPDVI